MTEVEPPDLALAMRLLDACRAQGFACRRVGTGDAAPLLCTRQRDGYTDEILLNGFSGDCYASRQRTSRLVIVGGSRTVYTIEGSAAQVLHTVLGW